MKRITALLLCVVLFYVLTVPIYAAEPETYSLRVSEYCEAVSMSDYRELFRDADDADKVPAHYRHETKAVKAGDKLTIHMAPGGGFVAKFTK